MSNKVLTITVNPALDVNSEAEKVVTGEKVRCEKPIYDPGGGGINVARVLTKLKIPVDAQYISGGLTGDFLTSLLQQEKVNSSSIEIEEAIRESISVIDNSSGEQYRFVFPGPKIEESVWGKILEELDDQVSRYEYVVASGSLPPGLPDDFYSRLGKVVLNHGKKYILDTSGDALLHGIKNGASFIKPNQEEFEELMKQSEADNNEDFIHHLHSMGIDNIIHTLGKEGTFLYNKNGKKKFTPPKIKVNSSIGAGDSFVGGLVAGLAKEMNINDAVCYGIATAASTLKSPGTSLCELEDVESIHADLCERN